VLAVAGECVERGREWEPMPKPARPMPAGIRMPVNTARMGSDGDRATLPPITDSADAFRILNPDVVAEVFAGWMTWPGTGTRMIQRRAWLVLDSGLLVDPATGTCGVPPGWAYVGVRAREFQRATKPESATATAVRRFRASIRARAGSRLGREPSLLRRHEARRAARRDRQRTRRDQ